MNVSEKIAYLKGLVEGLDIKAGSREDKLISAVVDVLDSISEELDGLNENAADMAEELDAVSDDLSVVEKEVFGDGDFETLEVVPGEYAFVTEMMPEKTFDEKLKNITDVLTVIRGNF